MSKPFLNIALGTRIAQQLYLDVKQRIFKSSLSFGHANLIRTSAFKTITVPPGVLSHDIWDMALLSKNGFSTMYCSDVISYEEVPSNYIEMCARDRRWIAGNMQSFPLLGMSDIAITARFYILYGIFMYVCQPIFLMWLALSIAGNSSVFGKFLFFQPIMGNETYPFYIELHTFTIVIFALIYGHKFVLCKRGTDCVNILREMITSTLISLNNIVYHSIALIRMMFQAVAWVPMKKNPYAHITLRSVAHAMWPSTLLGCILLYFIIAYCPSVHILIIPIIVCFTLSIPIVYVTSLPLER